MLSKADLDKAILLAQAESYAIMRGFMEAWHGKQERTIQSMVEGTEEVRQEGGRRLRELPEEREGRGENQALAGLR